MIIAVDFDGTLIRDGFPNVREGEPNVKLFNTLIECRKQGVAKVILWTCRGGEQLEEAVDFCREQGLVFDAVNENLKEALEAARFGHEPRKIFADIYIDDQARQAVWESDVLEGRE